MPPAGRRVPRVVPCALAALAVACGEPRRAMPAAETADATTPPAPAAAPASAVPASDSAVPGATLPPAPPAPAGAFSFVRRVGVIQDSRDAGPCLVIADSSLAPGTPLLLVFPDDPQKLGSAYVRARRERPCTEAGDEWGAVAGGEAGMPDRTPTPASYDVAVLREAGRDSSGARTDLGIAITWGAGLVALRGDSVAGDLDGDGRVERFGSCTSSEGIHLSVTGDSAGVAARRWHRYYYVPYDLEPTCR